MDLVNSGRTPTTSHRMSSTRSSPMYTALYGRTLNLLMFVFILFSLSSSIKEIKGHPPHRGDWHRIREARAASSPLYTNGKRPDASNARQISVPSPRQPTPVRRSVATTGKDEQLSEGRRHTRIPLAEKNIGELERDPSTYSDEKTRAARKSPTVKITAPIPAPVKKTTPSPLSIQVKTFTPKPNVSAVIEVIADSSNTSECKEEKGKEPPIEYIHLPRNIRTDELRLLNWYPMSTFKDPRAPLGNYPAAGEINEILPVEEIVLFGPNAGYGNQQPRSIYPPYASDTQSFVPDTRALGAMGYEPNVFLNALAPAPLVPNSLMAPQWSPNMQPNPQKFVTRSFHLKLDPVMEWVPI